MPLLSPSLPDSVKKRKRREREHRPISKRDSACEDAGASGEEGNNDAVSGRLMVKRERYLGHAFRFLGFS